MAPLLGSHSVFLGFAATTVCLHWMRCQSFKTSKWSRDQTGPHCNSPGKYGRNRGYPKDSWYSIGYSWRKEFCQSMERHPAIVKTAAIDLHRFDFDVMRQAHGGHLKHLESISLSCLHGEQDNLTQTQLLVMQSATIHMATRTVCIMCENCHVIIFLQDIHVTM